MEETYRNYTAEDVKEMVRKAKELGYSEADLYGKTIAEIDRLVNQPK